ncbi:hypothetical protein Tco_1480480 [Tanacetum coccineum]
MNDCFHLKRQLEIALESGKLNHLIKDVRQRGKGGQRNNDPQKEKVINMIQSHSSDRKRKTTMTDEGWMNVRIIFPPILARDLSEEALVVEAEVEGYLVRRVHIDEGASVEIMFEHCFNMLHLSIRSRLVETQTTVSGFSGEQVKLLGKMPKSNYEVHNHLGTFTLQHHLRMSRPKATQGSPFYHSWDDEISNPLGVATVISQTPVVFECRKEEKKQAVEPPKEEKVQDNTNPTD